MTNKPTSKTNCSNVSRVRITLIGWGFALFFLVIAGKAVYLQIHCGPDLSQKAADQYEKTMTIQGKRGIIYDRNRREMAVSIDVLSAGAYPGRIKDTAIAADALGKVLRIDSRALRLKLISKRSFIWLKRQITPDEEKALKSMKLDGIDFVPEHMPFLSEPDTCGPGYRVYRHRWPRDGRH